ncbi:MAG TPA: hypothetical protein VEY70_06400 [Metabacillus sp.]|nr:hypothetical protein [Metabacillus sp.]
MRSKKRYPVLVNVFLCSILVGTTFTTLNDKIAYAQEETSYSNLELQPNEDFDQDQLSNGEENKAGTNSYEKDTDNDGLSDFEEVN